MRVHLIGVEGATTPETLKQKDWREAKETYEQRLEEAHKKITKYRQMYLGMKGIKESAQAMDIDTENYVPTEADKQFARDHDYSEKHTQLESGKVRYLYSVIKKKNLTRRK